jgi:hypothetical protein
MPVMQKLFNIIMVHTAYFTLDERTPQYPPNTRLGGTQNWSERSGKEKNPDSAGNQSHVVQPIHPVELSINYVSPYVKRFLRSNKVYI